MGTATRRPLRLRKAADLVVARLARLYWACRWPLFGVAELMGLEKGGRPAEPSPRRGAAEGSRPPLLEEPPRFLEGSGSLVGQPGHGPSSGRAGPLRCSRRSMASSSRPRRLTSPRENPPPSAPLFQTRHANRCIDLHLPRDALLTASPASITAASQRAAHKKTGNHRF